MVRVLSYVNFESQVFLVFGASSYPVLELSVLGTIVIKEPPGKYLKREILGTSGHKPPLAVRFVAARI